MRPIADPARRAEIVALGQDLSLAYEIGAMRLALARVLAAVEDDAADPRLLRSAGTLGNVIARLVQTQARLAGQADPLAAELEQPVDFLDLDTDPGAAAGADDEPAPYPAPPVLETAVLDEAEPKPRPYDDIAAPTEAPDTPVSRRAEATSDESSATRGAPDRHHTVAATHDGSLAASRSAVASTDRHSAHAPSSPPRDHPSAPPPERPPRSARPGKKPGRRAHGQRR